MSNVNYLASVGLTNKDTDDYGNYAMGVKRKEPYSYCSSDKCCTYQTPKNVYNKKKNLIELKMVNVRKPYSEKFAPKGWGYCLDCGKTLIWEWK